MVKNFWQDESGAITVDWVVLAAAVVGLAIALITTVGGGAQDHADRVDDTFSSVGIRAY